MFSYIYAEHLEGLVVPSPFSVNVAICIFFLGTDNVGQMFCDWKQHNKYTIIILFVKVL